MWHANLQTIFSDGVNIIFEFGGGIGSGIEPAEKRPNLEGMIKKSLRGSPVEAQYQSVINLGSMQTAVEFTLGTGH
jgi:[acyl-carrier-protein] S-malonyltransferase